MSQRGGLEWNRDLSIYPQPEIPVPDPSRSWIHGWTRAEDRSAGERSMAREV